MGRKTTAIPRIQIDNPKEGKRATFSVLWDNRRLPNAKSQYEKLEHPTVIAINKQFLNSEVTFEEARKSLGDFRERQYKELRRELGVTSFSKYNRLTIQRYYDEKVKPRHNQDTSKRSMWNELNRAIELLENKSLRTVTAADIQDRIKHAPIRSQRRMITILQALLKFIERKEVDLYKPKETEKEVRYLTEEEFNTLFGKIPDDVSKRYPLLKDLFLIAFGTGCRESEIHGLRSGDLRIKNGEAVIYLERQKVRKEDASASGERIRLPKNRKKRWIVPLAKDQTVAAIKRWCSASDVDKEELRNVASPNLKRLCEELFKNEVRAHGGLHMLRASHAVALLSHGISLALVAKQLGDSIVVVEKYYSSFQLTEDQIGIVQKVLSAGSR